MSEFIDFIIPPLIDILELMGIIVLVVSSVTAFVHYCRQLIFHKHIAFKYQFADSIATALEFKMAAEILHTVIVTEVSEIYILGAVILLRAIMAIIIHWEMKEEIAHEAYDIEHEKHIEEQKKSKV